LRSIAGRLGDGLSGKITDKNVQEAVSFVLSSYGVSVSRPERQH
jgi:hypothetical protein